jgi:integrase
LDIRKRIPRKGWSFLTPKTKAGRRAIKVGDATLQILRKHRELQEIENAVARDLWKEHGLVFTSKVGTPGDPSNLRLDFNHIISEASLPRIRFHDLRHTAASLMLNYGVPVIVVSKRLGHALPSTTLDVYGNLYHEL